ncbi:MAG: hypothetical protein O2783_07305 [Chloroflexi bacterium]|nr:hypothetical protein [Chloroflexota bacterium]
MSELHSDDSYQLRKAQMDADRRALEAKKAQQELERLVLEMEHKYDLIADGRTIDPRTATIQGTSHTRKSNGKEIQEALETTALEVAAA